MSKSELKHIDSRGECIDRLVSNKGWGETFEAQLTDFCRVVSGAEQAASQAYEAHFQHARLIDKLYKDANQKMQASIQAQSRAS